MAGAVERGAAGSLPRKCTLFQHPRQDFGEQTPSSHHPEPFYFAFPTLMVQSGLGAGENESTASSSEISEAFCMLYSLSSDFHPIASSREHGAWQRITIKLNYSGVRNFSPRHLSSFLHLVPKQRKITQPSIRKGKNHKTSAAGVLDDTASKQPPGCLGCLPGCWTPPAHLPGVMPLRLQHQVISDKIICSKIADI